VGPNAGLGTCADLTVASFMAASCNYTGLMHWYELFNRLSVACRCQSRASGQPHDGILHYTAGLTHHCCSCWGETAVLLGCRCGKMMQSQFHDMPSMSTGLTVTVVRRARALHSYCLAICVNYECSNWRPAPQLCLPLLLAAAITTTDMCSAVNGTWAPAACRSTQQPCGLAHSLPLTLLLPHSHLFVRCRCRCLQQSPPRTPAALSTAPGRQPPAASRSSL
jgi:hypothetical protein